MFLFYIYIYIHVHLRYSSFMYINDLTYFSNLRILKESVNISDCDLEVYVYMYIYIYIYERIEMHVDLEAKALFKSKNQRILEQCQYCY